MLVGIPAPGRHTVFSSSNLRAERLGVALFLPCYLPILGSRTFGGIWDIIMATFLSSICSCAIVQKWYISPWNTAMVPMMSSMASVVFRLLARSMKGTGANRCEVSDLLLQNFLPCGVRLGAMLLV